MRRALLDERLSCCRRAGLTVRAVSVNPLAGLNVWCAQHQEAAPPLTGVFLYLLGGQMAEWMVWHTSSVQVVPVQTASADRFLQEVVTGGQALCAQLPERPTGLWVFGASEGLPQVREALAGSLNLRVESLDVARLIAPGSIPLDVPARCAVALGLALHGSGAARVDVNLLAHLQAVQRTRAVRRIAWTANGLFATATLCFVVSGMREVNVRHRLILQSLERQERVYQGLRPAVRSLLQRQQHTERRSRQLEQLAREAPLLTRLMAQAVEALPDHVWLTKVECSKSGSLFEGALEGRASSFQDVAQFVDRLKREAGMTTVKTISSNVVTEETSGKELIAFALQVQRGSR